MTLDDIERLMPHLAIPVRRPDGSPDMYGIAEMIGWALIPDGPAPEEVKLIERVLHLIKWHPS